MDLIKIIRTLEEFLFEVATWFVLWPKTLLEILRSPSWTVDYVSQEILKGDEARFDSHISPIIFFILTAVLPYFIVFSFLMVVKANSVANSGGSFLGSFSHEAIAMIIAIFMLAGPLGFATCISLSKKEGISKSGIRSRFYSQTYIFTPAYLALLPFMFIVFFTDFKPEIILASDIVGIIAIISCNVFFWWLLVSEVIVIKKTFDISVQKAILLSSAYFFVSYMFFFIVVLIMGLGAIFFSIIKGGE